MYASDYVSVSVVVPHLRIVRSVLMCVASVHPVLMPFRATFMKVRHMSGALLAVGSGQMSLEGLAEKLQVGEERNLAFI